jgi:hypothetical protein
MQSNLTVGQLVYYIEIEDKIEQNAVLLEKAGTDYAEKYRASNSATNEIEFRISRICSLFRTSSDTPVAIAENERKCSEFLKRIPFEGGPPQILASKSPIPTSTPPQPSSPEAEKKPSLPEPIPPAILQRIQQKFVEVMKDAKIGNTKFAEMVDIYQQDVEIIAEKNQQYRLFTKLEYDAAQENYLALCEHKKILIGIVANYHSFDLGDCAKYLSTANVLAGFGSPNLGVSSPAPSPQAAAAANPANPNSPGPAAAPVQNPSAGQQPAVAPPAASAAPTTPQDLVQQPFVLPGQAQIVAAGGQSTAADTRQRTFELVNNYKFYAGLPGGFVRGILLSPADFLALLLVGFCGILGALLRIVFFTYASGKDPSFRSFFVGPILGLICALVVYILFRAGFIAITDQSQTAETSSLSPFVIAIVAMAAGLLSERSIDLLRKTSGTWLGSAEASQGARWAVHLQRAISDRGLTIDTLASRLDVSADKLKQWAAEEDVVPGDKQREIALVLDMPIRAIFTDLGPSPKMG